MNTQVEGADNMANEEELTNRIKKLEKRIEELRTLLVKQAEQKENQDGRGR